MKLSDENRINYEINQIVETPTKLIIQSKVFNKKSLIKISDKNIESGLFNLNKTSKVPIVSNLIQCDKTIFTTGSHSTVSISSISGKIIDENGYSVNICNCIDGSKEYTIYGDSYIIYDNETSKYERNYLLDSQLRKITTNLTAFLYQDSEFIYFVSTTNTYLYQVFFSSFNKNTKIVTNIKQISLDTDFPKVCILKRYDDSVDLLITSSNKKASFLNVTFANNAVSEIKMNPLSNPSTILPITTGALAINGYDKNGYVYYAFENDIKSGLACFKIRDKAADLSSLRTSLMTDETNIKTAEYFKTKFEIDDANILNFKKSKLNFVNYTYNNVLNHNIFVLGDNEEYLLHSLLSDTIGKEASTNGQYIAIYTRNDAENPLDLTLVDYVNLSDLDSTNKMIFKNMYRIDTNKFILPFNNGFYIVNFNAGKLKFNKVDIKNIMFVGIDEYKRLYISSANEEIEILSERVPRTIELNYENLDDSTIVLRDEPITKQIRVKTLNFLKNPISANFKLEIMGDGTIFESSQNTELRGRTDENGEAIVNVIFSKKARITISGNVLYNNELSMMNISSQETSSSQDSQDPQNSQGEQESQETQNATDGVSEVSGTSETSEVNTSSETQENVEVQ